MDKDHSCCPLATETERAGSSFKRTTTNQLDHLSKKRREDALPDALCCLDRTPRFDLAEDGKDQRRRQVPDRKGTDRWKDIALQASDHVTGMDRCPLSICLFEPLSSDLLEGQPCRLDHRFYLELLHHIGVMAFGEMACSFVALQARIRQRQLGVGTEGEGLLLAVIIIAIAPE